MLRTTVVLQTLASVWFWVAPDTLPYVLREAEMANDRPLYETLDNLIVPLVHLQTVLCVLLWRPVKLVAFGYLGCVVLILALGAFAGPAVLADLDGTVSGVQGLASGAMIMLLYQAGLFRLSSAKSDDDEVVQAE